MNFKYLKKTLILIVAIIFILLGLAGLALPFLQGFLFLAIGIVLLSLISTRVRSWVEVHTRTYPKIHRLVERTQNWILRIIGPYEE